jgi:hypothetical protein
VAECLDAAIVTQGRTLGEVAANIREAAALLMEDKDAEELGLARDATVLALMELEWAAAETKLTLAKGRRRRGLRRMTKD